MNRLEGHDGDCTIYSALANGNLEDGICTCGYGRQCLREGNPGEMYSEERERALGEKAGRLRLTEADLTELLGNIAGDEK